MPFRRGFGMGRGRYGSKIFEEEKILQCHKRKKYKVKDLKAERP